MTTDPVTLATLAQWLSPAYPVGAFSYSHGLEQAVASGHVTDAPGFGLWLRDCLEHGAGRTDAILLVAAHGAARDDAGDDALSDLDALARALAPSCERLAETAQMGAAFLATSAAIWPVPDRALCYPVAVGAAARAAGFPLLETAVLYLHGFAANLTSAAIRLVPLGQTAGQAELAAIAPCCADLARRACELTPDDIGGCTYAADIASMRHETMYSRLFQS